MRRVPQQAEAARSSADDRAGCTVDGQAVVYGELRRGAPAADA